MKKKYFFKIKTIEILCQPYPKTDITRPGVKSLSKDIEITETEYNQLKDKSSILISYYPTPSFWGEEWIMAKVEGEWEVYILENK